MKWAIIFLLVGSHIAVYFWAEANTQAQHSEDTAIVVAQALKDHQEAIKDAYLKNTKLKQEADRASQRISQLRKSLVNTSSSCAPGDTSLRVLIEAVRDPALQPAGVPFYTAGERVSIDSYCLYVIGEANRVKVKLNALVSKIK